MEGSFPVGVVLSHSVGISEATERNDQILIARRQQLSQFDRLRVGFFGVGESSFPQRLLAVLHRHLHSS